MSDFTDWKDTLTKEPDSGKKYYAVGCETASQWQHIDFILKEDGSNEEAIPSESMNVLIVRFIVKQGQFIS